MRQWASHVNTKSIATGICCCHFPILLMNQNVAAILPEMSAAIAEEREPRNRTGQRESGAGVM